MPTIFFERESASCSVEYWDDTGYLVSLKSTVRRQGHATALLTLVTQWADVNQVPLQLVAAPYGEGEKLGPHGLIQFYKKFGFVQVPPHTGFYHMRREPSQEIHTA